MKLRLLGKMKFFSRKRDKRREAGDDAREEGRQQHQYLAFGSGTGQPDFVGNPSQPAATRASARVLLALPDRVLQRVFAAVCPHSRDETYEKCEESSMGDACMLCDLRDLAHCVQVCRRWRSIAPRAL